MPTASSPLSSNLTGSPNSLVPTFVHQTDVLKKPDDKFVASIRALITFASASRPLARAFNNPEKYYRILNEQFAKNFLMDFHNSYLIERDYVLASREREGGGDGGVRVR